MKKCVKAISFLTVLAFVLSMLSISVFASTSAASGDWLWTGDDKPTFRDGVKSSSTKYSTVLNYVGGKFGKAQTDKAYEVYDIGSSHSLSQWGDFPLQDAVSSFNDFAVEFSFAFPSYNDGIELYAQVYYNNALTSTSTISNFFKITSDTVYLLGTKHTKTVANEDIMLEPGKWYNLALVIDVENDHTKTNTTVEPASSYTHKLYINGELFVQATIEPAQGAISRVYGDYRLRLGNLALDDTVYYDNMKVGHIADAASFVPADATEAVLTSNNTGVSVTGKNIGVPAGTTVGALKQALVSSGANDNIRFYSSDFTEELTDSASAENINVVVASPRVYSETETRENTYAYYTTAKAYKTFSGGILDASSIGAEIESGTKTLVKVTNGTNGKYDEVYEISTTSDGSTASTAGYHPEPFAIVESANAGQRVLEFACMLPQGSRGVRFISHCWGCSHRTSNAEPHLGITPDGFKVLYTVPNVIPYTFEYDKWYNVAIVIHGKNETETCGSSITLYVNGERIGSTTMDEVLGVRRVRIAPVSASGGAKVFAYLDNLRMYDTNYLNEQYDVSDSFTTSYDVDEKTEKFYISGNTTVEDVKASISDINEDTNIYVLDANGDVLDDTAIVTDGCTLALSAMNQTVSVRTVSYYDVENIAGEFVVKTPLYSMEASNALVNFETINNTSAEKTVYAILAVYNSDGSLKGAQPVKCTTAAGAKGVFAEGITAQYGETDKVRFMIWESVDTGTTPVITAMKLK